MHSNWEGSRLSEITPKPTGGERPAAEEHGQPGTQQAEIVLNDREAHAAYANFARVTTTHEEVIVDFGLNPNPFLTGKQEVKVTQRLIMNFYTAKRLASALAMMLQRLEQAFGPIETDVR